MACVVLVDASSYAARARDKYVGNLVHAQVAQADLHVVSKTDLNPNFELHYLTPQLSSEDPELIEAVLGWRRADAAVATDILLSRQTSFRAHTWHQEGTITRASLATFIDELDESVQRVKGWVDTFEGIYQVSKVASQVTMTELTKNQPPPALLGLVIITYGDAGSASKSTEHVGGFAPDQITMALPS